MECACGRPLPRRRAVARTLPAVALAALVLAALALSALAAPPDDADGSSDCASYDRCRKCVQKPHCRWCTDIGGKPQCLADNDTRSCIGGKVYQHKSFVKKGNDTRSQIQPQSIELGLHVGTNHTFEIVFEKKEDYPVDLYYLMDLSNSMRDDKDNIINLGRDLKEALKNLTTNFHLGFGSFVDKVAMPFVNTAPELLKNPCLRSNQICAPPYSFKNHMPLTNNTEQFSYHVQNANISGNIDYPEGGFDALMQAIVCTEKIGWRPSARHLLVMATDATFHLAGDGKLAGVVEPNDEQCHLSEVGDYTHYLEYDYPSISQIDRKAWENDINIFFAVTDEVKEDYMNLKISTATSQVLSNNSDNILLLVVDQYKTLVETLELEDNAKKEGVNIRYETRCTNASGPFRNTQTCRDVNAKKTPITFRVTVNVPSCPNDAKEILEKTINIKVRGLNESMELKLRVFCGCSCEESGKEGYEENSDKCNKYGTLTCGICECKEGKIGRTCECDDGADPNEIEDESCYAPNSTEVCSGQGHCQCGVCRCNPFENQEVYGTYCQCNDYSCPRIGGRICSGPEKGECKCGKCECRAGFTGVSCEQAICGPDDNCFESPNAKLCSGFGTCVCGMCECTGNRTGTYCEKCLTCPDSYCSKLKKYVGIEVHHIGDDGQDHSKVENMTVKIIPVDVIEEKALKGKVCNVYESGCSFTFAYELEDDKFTVFAENNKACPTPLDLLGIVFGVIGGTVLLGLVSILIWKILTTIHDRREYAKFERERALSKWDRGDNPLYKQATTTFSNPTFGK